MNEPIVYIERISIQGLYGQYNLEWNLNKNVNILVGINGSGKTTIFNIVDYLFSGNLKKIKQYNLKYVSIAFNKESQLNLVEFFNNEKNTLYHILPLENRYTKINTFDVPSKSRTKSILDDALEELIFKKKEDNAFTFLDYRLNILENPKNDVLQIQKYQKKINDFFSLINTFFKDSNKIIETNKKNNSIKFINIENGTEISLRQLSAGEKQLLILLFKVFLQDEKPSILILDEPEISMHIRWQQILIDTLIELNPNMQLIASTHSPSVFGKGWSGHIFRMEELYINE